MDYDRDSVEIIGIAPLACPRCRADVAEEDAFCPTCGADLLEGLPHICGNCGKALASEAAFCSGCGRDVNQAVVDATTIVSAPPPEPRIEKGETKLEVAPEKPWRRRKWLAAGAAVVLLAAAAAAGWWFGFRTDHTKFDSGLTAALDLAADTQALTEDVSGPEDLDRFAGDVRSLQRDVDAIERTAAQTDGVEFQEALQEVADAESVYLAELARLGELPSAEAQPAQYVRVEELRDELVVALDTGVVLRGRDVSFPDVNLSAIPVTAALSDLAEYRKEVLGERAKIRRINDHRAEELEEVTAVTEQLDGIIGRYGDGRGELQDWVDRVRSTNASIQEGYQVLESNVGLREQIRTELAGLNAPAPFSSDVQALLPVVDDAISANQAAVRGIDEYLGSFRYWSVFETPGWAEFQETSDRVTDSFGSAVETYESHKKSVVQQLSKKLRLPDLPD
jgi:hypothetical protein